MSAPGSLRLRVQFTKQGPARYLSHAEFSRVIMFSARRAGLPLEYSGKFRARMKISLSPPIPIGITSECELVDFQLTSYLPPAEAQRVLAGALPEGIEAISCRLMDVQEKPVGKLIDTATYEVALPETAGSRGEWENAVAEFLGRDSVEYERVQPRRTRVVDLRPGVHWLRVEEGEQGMPLRMSMAVDDGTRGTVKAWEVIEVLAGSAGVPREAWAGANVSRLGLYSRRGDRLVSPMDAGRRKPAVSRRGGRSY